MPQVKSLVLKNGKIQQLDFPNDTLEGDFLSGTTIVHTTETLTIPSDRQSITFIQLTLDGNINLEGDLWLA
jgi:hypothetical protein